MTGEKKTCHRAELAFLLHFKAGYQLQNKIKVPPTPLVLGSSPIHRHDSYQTFSFHASRMQVVYSFTYYCSTSLKPILPGNAGRICLHYLSWLSTPCMTTMRSVWNLPSRDQREKRSASIRVNQETQSGETRSKVSRGWSKKAQLKMDGRCGLTCVPALCF